jgi:hypothetical protein
VPVAAVEVGEQRLEPHGALGGAGRAEGRGQETSVEGATERQSKEPD